jgi:hypothetical protein
MKDSDRGSPCDSYIFYQQLLNTLPAQYRLNFLISSIIEWSNNMIRRLNIKLKNDKLLYITLIRYEGSQIIYQFDIR